MKKPTFFAGALLIASIMACSTSIAQTEPSTVTVQETVNQTQTVSNADFETTNTRLKTAIESRGLTLFAVVDHAAGAAKVDQTLAPNTLYIFGNPKAGTPLMLANPAMGLHLPLKANVREENGDVIVEVSDIRALTTSAGVDEPAQVINNIAGALNAIMTEAASG